MILKAVKLLGLLTVVGQISGQGLILKHEQEYVGQTVLVNRLFDEAVIAAYDAWDFDGDGQQDIVISKQIEGNWCYYVYGLFFSELWSSYPDCPGASSLHYPIFLDFDGDGFKEVVYQDNSLPATVIVYSPHLGMCILSEGSSQMPVGIMDYEGDGLPDIVIEQHNQEGCRVWGAGTTSSSPPSNLVIRPEGDNLILHWAGVDSCSLYNIQWAFTLNGEYADIGMSCTTEFIHNGAAIVPQAFYRVTAITSTFGELTVADGIYRAVNIE